MTSYSAVPFPNDGSFMERFLAMQQATSTPTASAAVPPPPPPPDHFPETLSNVTSSGQNEHDFTPSRFFEGRREGYVFKLGDFGLGYYVDKPPVVPTPAKPAVVVEKKRPIVLKSNKSIVKVPLKKTAEDSRDVKKARTDSTDEAKPRYLREMERYRAVSCDSDAKQDRPLVK